MGKDLEQKEIRSNKVRNIMVEKPPIIIRYGTVIIAALLFIVFIIVLYAINQTYLGL